MSQAKKYITYQIVEDHDFMDKQFALTQDDRNLLMQAHQVMTENTFQGVPLLEQLIKKHPHLPQLKNILSTLLINLGKTQDAIALNRKTVEAHPDYLFAKLNLATEYINAEEFDKAKEILGEKLDLHQVYPERDTFHIQEVIAYFQTTVQYLMGVEEIEEAKNRVDLLLELDKDNEVSKQLQNSVQIKMMAALAQLDTKEPYDEEYIRVKAECKKSKKQEAPSFTHQEMDWLYKHEITIQPKMLQDILALPRETIINDLETAVADSIERFNHFCNLKNPQVRQLAFPLHSIMLLGELKAEESLPVILRFLSQDDDYYDFFFGDWIEQYIWNPVYFIIQNQLEEVSEFMLTPGICTTAKRLLLDTVGQIAAYQPERKQEVVNYLRQWLKAYSEAGTKDNLVDIKLITPMIRLLACLTNIEWTPYVQELFDKGRINEVVYNNHDHLIAQSKDLKDTEKRIMKGIVERYADNISIPEVDTINEVKEGSQKVNQSFLEEMFANFNAAQKGEGGSAKDISRSSFERIGRNDPCPCGSGKKYKKCCMVN